jgi:hypothetical protein
MPIATRPKARRDLAEVRPANNRSRVSNGVDILPHCDGRSLVARRYRDIASMVASEQNPDQLSEARKQLIRRFAAASVLAEQMEARLANGEQINVTEHALLCSTLVRLTQRIGLNRAQRNLTPSLEEYLAAKRRERERATQ